MTGRLDEAEAQARRDVARVLADVPPGEPVVVGVSGGADSLALAAVLAFVGPRADWPVTAIVVDHALQPDSADVAQRAVEQCRALGLSAEVVTVEVGTDGGPEAAARAARRTALLDHAATIGARAVCLAHTADDQAETVLLALGRGSGARSLTGMAEVAGAFRRPLLGLRRTDTRRICAVRGLDPWDDPHNVDPAFRRVRVRHEVLPLLDDVVGGGVVGALTRTAEQLARDTELLDALAAEWIDAHPHADGSSVEVAALAGQHAAIRTRVLRAAAVAAGASDGELSAKHVAELDRLLTEPSSGRRVELPGSVTCTGSRERLRFGPTPVAR